MANYKKYYATPKETLAPSYFSSLGDSHPTPMGWEEYYLMTTGDEQLRRHTAECRRLRREGKHDEYKIKKAQCGAITPAAQCEGGHRAEHVQRLTGVCLTDLDNIADSCFGEILRRVREDKHTFFCHTTASGSGLRILFRYASESGETAYSDAWQQGNQYYEMITGHASDQKVRDVSRLSFMSHDAEAYYNPESQPFYVADETDDDSDAIVGHEEDDLISGCERRLRRWGVEWTAGNRHYYMMRMARLMVLSGIDKQTAWAYAERHREHDVRDSRRVIDWVYQRNAGEFGMWAKADASGSTDAGWCNIVGSKTNGSATGPMIRDYILSHARLRYNVISGYIEVWHAESACYEDLNDRVQNSLWLECQEAFGETRVRQQDVNDVIHSLSVPTFNPFKSYLESLPDYDPEVMPDYIDQLAQSVHLKGRSAEESALFRKCFKKWFAGIIPPLLGGGVTNQTVMILIGPQGIYKSTFFFNLLPPELRRYYMTKTNQAHMTKDDKLALCEYALIGLEELDSMSDRDLNQIKALITTPVVSERAAYARVKENRPHIASFCGTGNNKHFLTDLTGNRRWLPFEVECIDSPYEHPFDYAGLYSQSYHLYREGFEYWFSQAESAELEKHVGHFMAANLEVEQIQRYFRKPNRSGTVAEQGRVMTTSQILERCNQGLKTLLSAKSIGQAMVKLGFEKKHTMRGNGYVVVEIATEEAERLTCEER